ncbi:MAG: polysaccharide pyruvyl transferase family protein [Alphaproteobacteria bacterium]|nr:polysaccharide pyruvyl transferase family protein [Alphaproteobacteria bacterium]
MTCRPVSLFYCKGQNFGDAVNPILLERVFGCPCVQGTKANSTLIAIGSIFQRFATNNPFENLIKPIYPKLHVFSTGFISDKQYRYFKRQMEIYAVRGYYTKGQCEKILGKQLDIPVRDAGLLLSHLLEKRPQKKYALGIIPHVSDWDNPIFEELSETPYTTRINLREDPLVVLNNIAECDCVISTALHGLIAADSLGIPNKWIEVSKAVEGNGYKFRDYYSVFGFNSVQPLVYRGGVHNPKIKIQDIYDDYCITPSQVQKIQQDLLRVFPFR